MTSCWNKKNSTTRKDNRVYYINLESGISQWGIPANNMLLPAGWEIHFSKSKKRMFYSNLKKKIIQWDKPTKEDGNEVPEGWKEMKSSKCNSIYYKNTKTGEVQWIIPDDLSIKPVGIGIPTSFLPIVEDCSQNEDIWKWKETDKIGSGGYGSVYTTCKGMDCDYVVKVQQKNENYYTEIDALLSLQNTNAVPKVFASWTCENFGYFVMEKLYPCEHDNKFMWKEVLKKLDIIKDQGYLHFDISRRSNVMCNKEGEVILIDFGLAIKRTKQGDNEGYKTDHAALLTWEELAILQEQTIYDHFDFNSHSLDSTSRTEYELAKEKALKKYNVVREKIIAAGVIWWQEQEKIRKQKESVKPDDIPTIFVESTKPITKLSKKDVKPVGIGIPKSFRDIVEDCTQNNKWKKDKLLGSGKAGSVYIACKTADDCEYVIKIQNQNKEYYAEIEALSSLQHTKAVPKVFAAWTCDKFGYFVMEKLYPCIHHTDNSIWMAVGIKLDIIRKEGYLQVDIHNGNVMCNKEGQVVLIDFGYAVKRTDKGDKQEYPDHIVSENYGIPLTWEYLEIVQENNYNQYLNPKRTQQQKDRDKDIRKKYQDAKAKVLLNKQEKEKILKQKMIKQIIPPRLQLHLDYQNGIIKPYPTWEEAKDEISNGKKKDHWIWYVFPSFFRVREHSSIPDLILKDLNDVKAYIANDVLRKRLIDITNIARMQLNKGIKANVLFGTELDALKFWECITLFFLVSDNGISLELHEVCDKALSALHPDAQMQDRLEPNTVNAFIQADGEILEQKRSVESENLLKNSALRLLRTYSKKETNEDAINFLLNTDLRGKESFQLNDMTFSKDAQIIGMSSAPLWSVTLSVTKDGIRVPLYNNYDGKISFY